MGFMGLWGPVVFGWTNFRIRFNTTSNSNEMLSNLFTMFRYKIGFSAFCWNQGPLEARQASFHSILLGKDSHILQMSPSFLFFAYLLCSYFPSLHLHQNIPYLSTWSGLAVPPMHNNSGLTGIPSCHFFRNIIVNPTEWTFTFKTTHFFSFLDRWTPNQFFQ